MKYRLNKVIDKHFPRAKNTNFEILANGVEDYNANDRSFRKRKRHPLGRMKYHSEYCMKQEFRNLTNSPIFVVAPDSIIASLGKEEKEEYPLDCENEDEALCLDNGCQDPIVSDDMRQDAVLQSEEQKSEIEDEELKKSQDLDDFFEIDESEQPVVLKSSIDDKKIESGSESEASEEEEERRNTGEEKDNQDDKEENKEESKQVQQQPACPEHSLSTQISTQQSVESESTVNKSDHDITPRNEISERKEHVKVSLPVAERDSSTEDENSAAKIGSCDDDKNFKENIGKTSTIIEESQEPKSIIKNGITNENDNQNKSVTFKK